MSREFRDVLEAAYGPKGEEYRANVQKLSKELRDARVGKDLEAVKGFSAS